MSRFHRGEQVWWTTYGGRKNIGVVVVGRIYNRYNGITSVGVAPYNAFLSASRDYYEYKRSDQVHKFNPEELSKLNEDIKLITIGRLQYNQYYFKKSRHSKVQWKKYYQQYKKVCKYYGIPVSPRRTVPNLSADW